MGCELPTIKFFVFLFNTISALLGICTIVVNGLALQHYQDDGRMICVFIMVLGAIAALLSIFGCCGAIRENICLTWTYAVSLFVVIIGNIVIIFKYLNEIDGETKASKNMKNTWMLQLKGKDVMSDIQTSLKCCGINNSSDYINASLTIPNSCFVGGDYEKSMILFSQGCLAKLIAVYEAAEHWLTIFIWSSLNVEFIAFISACILAVTFINEKRRSRY